MITKCIAVDNCEKKEDCLRFTKEEEENQSFADLSPGIFEECESYIDKKRYEGKL